VEARVFFLTYAFKINQQQRSSFVKIPSNLLRIHKVDFY